MIKRVLQGLAGIVMVAAMAPHGASAQMTQPEGEPATVEGTVVDLDCKFRNGLSGEQHRTCAQVCADNGLPLVILGDDGKLYMPVGGGMPGSPQNPRLKEFAEQHVRIRGMVYEAGNAMALEIASIEKS